MRIDNWQMDRIMRLPDWCFGRRWPVGLCVHAEEGNANWDMAELALPERCVLWEVCIWSPHIMTFNDYFRLALGNQLPTAAAMMTALDPLLPSVGMNGPEPRQIIPFAYMDANIRRLRMQIESGGRRPILEVQPAVGATIILQVILTFSSCPREVPDWLSSAKAINL